MLTTFCTNFPLRAVDTYNKLLMMLRKLLQHKIAKFKEKIFILKTFGFPLIRVTLYSCESGEYEEFQIGSESIRRLGFCRCQTATSTNSPQGPPMIVSPWSA